MWARVTQWGWGQGPMRSFSPFALWGLGKEPEVITVGNAGVPPIAAIRAAGAMPCLVDVDPKTLLMDIRQLEGARTPRTRAILPVHLYGQPVDLNGVMSFAAENGLAVIEDCAQAHGAKYAGSARWGLWGGRLFFLLSDQEPGGFWRWWTLRNE